MVDPIDLIWTRVPEIRDGFDLDRIRDGRAIVVENPTNGPGTGTFYVFIYTTNVNGQKYTYQKATNVATGAAYTRVAAGGTWTDWAGVGAATDASETTPLLYNADGVPTSAAGSVWDPANSELTITGASATVNANTATLSLKKSGSNTTSPLDVHGGSGGYMMRFLLTADDADKTPAMYVSSGAHLYSRASWVLSGSYSGTQYNYAINPARNAGDFPTMMSVCGPTSPTL